MDQIKFVEGGLQKNLSDIVLFNHFISNILKAVFLKFYSV